MNRHIDPDRLALYAGGDLPEREAASTGKHIADCPRCAALLEELIRARKLAADALWVKTPPTMPVDSTERVMTAAEYGRTRRKSSWRYRYRVTWQRIAAVAAILAAAFWAGRLSQRSPGKKGVKDINTTVESAPPAVTLDSRLLRMLPVMGPYPVNEPLPATTTGVYLLLFRSQPENSPDLYTVEYIGEYSGPVNDELSRIIASMTDRTVPRDHLYILFYPMSSSSTEQRQRVAQALIQAYKPN